MPRPREPGLTENELEVMKILWKAKDLAVSDILEKIKRSPKPAYTSLMTVVQTMEKKGYIHHHKEGKAFLYSPTLQKKNFLSTEMKRMAKRLFDGSPASLVMNLVEEEQLSKKDIAELREFLEKHR